jgi:hypothetical protein
MFTCRNVFSMIFASSASPQPGTGTVLSTNAPKNASTAASDGASIPATIFGVLCSPNCGLPGSIRSGE